MSSYIVLIIHYEENTNNVDFDERLDAFGGPANGVIFSDGVEEDYLEFNSGSIAAIGLADRRVNLAVIA